MAKKYKKYKVKKKQEQEEESAPYSRFLGKYAQSPRRERTPEQKKEYKKLALFMVVWIIFVASVYFACVQLEFAPVMPIYTVAGVVFFVIWLIYNGGFKKVDVTQYEKPDEMGYDEFCRFIDKLKERQRKSKYFLILFMPFIIVMLIDWWMIRKTPADDTNITDQAGSTEITDTNTNDIIDINNNADNDIIDMLETEN